MGGLGAGKERKIGGGAKRDGRPKGIKQEPDQDVLPAKSVKMAGRLTNEGVEVHEVTHSATHESGEKPSRESDL